MTSRSKYTFVTLPEFADWLLAIANELGAAVVLYRGPGAPLEKWDGRLEALTGVSRAYLTEHPVEIAGVRAADLSVGLLGWVQLDVPRSDGTCLLASQIATKSDWFDARTQTVMDNPAALRLFDKLWSRWKKHLMFPVWARNRTSGAEAPYQSMGYSQAAAEWFQRGGQLRQEGVHNIEFTIRSATPSGSAS